MGMIYEYDAFDRAALFGMPVRQPVSLTKRVTLGKPSDRTQTVDSSVTSRILRQTNDLRKLHLLFKVQTMGKMNV